MHTEQLKCQEVTVSQWTLRCGSAVIASLPGPDPRIEDVVSQVDGEDWTFVPVAVLVI